MLAAFAEENALATIVGTKTAARLLSGFTFKAGSGSIVGLPVAAYLTWQGRLIEGKGVTPSIPVELSEVNNVGHIKLAIRKLGDRMKKAARRLKLLNLNDSTFKLW